MFGNAEVEWDETKFTNIRYTTYDPDSEAADENGYVNVTLNQEKISQVKIIDLDQATEELVNLDGLEYFTNLELLVAVAKNLTTLDVSKLPNLNTLDCSENPELKELDVSANTKLQALVCQDTGISELNLSNNLDLMDLTCARTNITILDLSKNTKLKVLECNSAISKLDLSNNPVLEELICYSCHFYNRSCNNSF